VAVKLTVEPVEMDALLGVIDTETPVGCVTVTAVLCRMEVRATLVAIT
jgi:hypothetical protein